MKPEFPASRLRWLILGVFVLSSALNYLDRQLLPALAPDLRARFQFSNADYGLILAAFSIAYAVAAPLAGLFVDRVGLNCGISLAVGLWSAAGIATAFARSFAGFAACRAALGLAQAGGIPSAGKAIAKFLRPEERALGNAVSQLGIGIGAMLAPPLGIGLARVWGWPAAFLVTGAAGLLWIPLWNRTARLAAAPGGAGMRPDAEPEVAFPAAPPPRPGALLRERRLWLLVFANVLSMTVYTLWSNWTTVLLVQVHRMPLERTASYAAVPPLFFNLGGLLGGWLSLRWMHAGMAAFPARLRACALSAVAMLATAAVPFLPGPGLAIAGICFSAFWASAMSVNLYTVPLDLWGAARAAFAISMLTGAYGAMQAAFSPVAGALIDHFGFTPVCAGVALLPLCACALLARARALGRD